MRITVWNEFVHEKTDPAVKEIYPDGIHAVIADFLGKAGHKVCTATLDEPECGLTEEVLENTDVLFWWGHCSHDAVPDEIVEQVARHVYEAWVWWCSTPAPDELLFISWFSGGEVCRSGCIYKRGRGKIFYFRPGHETVPTYYNPKIQQVLINSIPYVTTPRYKDYQYGQVSPMVEG